MNAAPLPDGKPTGFEFRQGYLEFGQAEEGFQARVGRQEILVGEERLVGADAFWDFLGQTFDAVKFAYNKPNYQLQAFTGYRVAPSTSWPYHTDRANQVSGLSAQLKNMPGKVLLEPYLLWKKGFGTLDLSGNSGHRDVVSPGVHAQGDLPRALDFNVETAFQAGHVVGDRVRAWATHAEIGWKPLGKDVGPRISFEYNYASGDNNPADGHHNSFDDMYPAGFNSYGITDPFAWRNISYPAVSVALPLNRRWTLQTTFRSYSLATVNDGLYPGGDEYSIRNPDATSTHIGNQFYVATSYTQSTHWRFYAGYGHLFAGSFLQQSAANTGLNTVYLLSSFSF